MEHLTGSEADLARLYAPRSVAVVGASARPGALSWWPLHLLRRYGFPGGIHPVNPGRDEIDGLRCHPSIGEVPGTVDVAVVVLNAERTPAAVRECADAGVGVVVLPTQGLGELSEDGRAIEREMIAYARARGMRIAGPNTDGTASPATGLMATIQPIFGEGIEPGPVAVVAQSGATAASIVRRLKDAGIGCRYYTSTGNEVDLGMEDHLSYVLQDPEVRMVVSFVESIRRPDAFLAVADLADRLGKPIVLVKVGRSDVGARRAAAHTGALAGEDRIYDAVFQSAGVIRVSELSELVAVARLHLAAGGLRAPGVGIVSVSGGQAGSLADAAFEAGVPVPAVDETEMDGLLQFGAAFNPCDLTGAIATTPTLTADVYRGFSRSPELGIVVYARKQLTGTAGAAAADELARAAAAGPIPVAVYAMDGVVEGDEAAVYEQAGIPVFASARELFLAVRSLAGRRREGAPPPADPVPLAFDGTGPLSETASKRVVAAYGVAVPRESVAEDAEAAVEAARAIGGPVVLKAVSGRIPHKTEAGCVVVGVVGDDAVRSAYAQITANAAAVLDGAHVPVLVAEQIDGGIEMLVGVTVDPGFGPFVVVGAGGVLTEVLDDVAIAPAPVSGERAREMVDGLRLRRLLDGYRGGPALDVDALVDTVVRVGRLAADHADRIAEVDLNPVVVLPVGAVALDALVVAAEKP